MPNNYYTPSSSDIVAPGTTSALSEFYGFLGDCGQAAGEVFSAILTGTAPSSAHLNSVVNQMIGKGDASASGVTSSAALQRQFSREGIQTSVVDNWRAAINNVLGRAPAELFLTNAGNLPGETPSLHGHFVTVVGYSPSTQKYIVSDPNSAAAQAGKFSLYSASDLANAGASNAIIPVDNAINKLGSLSNPISGVFGGIVADNIRNGFNAFASLFGAQGFKDFTWRATLIVSGIVLVIVALIMLAFNHVRNTVQNNPQALQAITTAAAM